MCITASLFCLENYAIQMLTISSCTFLQSSSWSCSLSVLRCQGVRPWFHAYSQLLSVDEYLCFEVTPKEIIAYTVQAMENHCSKKWHAQDTFLMQLSRKFTQYERLKPHGLLVNSTSVNFWCEEIMRHVNIATRIYCHSMSIALKKIWAY
jgi:hypothetical protein